MSLRALKILFTAIGLLYLLSPYDLLPDMAGLVGRLDDLLLGAYLIYQYHRLKRRGARAEESASGAESSNAEEHRFDYGSARPSHEEWESAQREGSGKKSGSEGKKPSPQAFDPYQVFDLPHGASTAEIESRYRELMKRYHPDRVNHLGEEFRTLAHERTVEIQRAYDMLRRTP